MLYTVGCLEPKAQSCNSHYGSLKGIGTKPGSLPYYIFIIKLSGLSELCPDLMHSPEGEAIKAVPSASASFPPGLGNISDQGIWISCFGGTSSRGAHCSYQGTRDGGGRVFLLFFRK